MCKRLLMLLVFAANLATAAPNVASDPASRVDLSVAGVLISAHSRSALINDGVAREGDRVDGIEILAIDKGAVRIRNGLEELSIPVGSTVGITPSPPRLSKRALSGIPADHSIRHVNDGETLSQIAEDYAGPAASLNQVMMALYDANPHAFNGNIHRLRAGTDLRIPSDTEVRGRTPAGATAEVLYQTETWRGGDRPPLVAQLPLPVDVQPEAVSAAATDKVYGPVGHGETLSEIAQRLASDGVSMQRVMAALLDRNPQAFGGSIHLLREGAILRIPDFDAIDPGAVLAATRH